MKLFNRPKNLNGAELIAELKSEGIIVQKVIDYGNGKIGLDVEDESKTEAIVKNHNGTTVEPEQTFEQKLASVGLNLTDLKTALGL